MAPLLWNLYARCYHSITGLLPYQELLDDVMAAIDLAPGMRVLDVGCGTGALAERIVAEHPDVELVGVDMAKAMLARARARRSWPSSVRFIEGAIDDVLACETAPFDRIVSVNVLWTLPDPQRTLAALAARLNLGGTMVHTTPSWRFRAHAIVWRHLQGLTRGKGWRLLLGLPMLAVAGLLNLMLVVQSMLRARGSGARKRWHDDGLAELLRTAGVPVRAQRPCYVGQNVLLLCRREPP
jgi:SAM-dependent methyltransferase